MLKSTQMDVTDADCAIIKDQHGVPGSASSVIFLCPVWLLSQAAVTFPSITNHRSCSSTSDAASCVNHRKPGQREDVTTGSLAEWNKTVSEAKRVKLCLVYT